MRMKPGSTSPDTRVSGSHIDTNHASISTCPRRRTRSAPATISATAVSTATVCG